MTHHEMKVGSTYECLDGKLRKVESIEGQRLGWRQAGEPEQVTTSGEMSVGRFASICVKEVNN